MLLDLQNKELSIEKKVEYKRKLYVIMNILYFLLHLIIFYALIYQIYGRDEIEPVSYVVGNIYWITGIVFFLTIKSKSA